MRVLLIHPPLAQRKVYGHLHRAGGLSLPIGIASLAACSLAAGHETQVLDCAAEGITLEDLAQTLAGKQYDVVGITAVTASISSAGAAAALIRRQMPEALLVVGGPHASALPERTLQEFASLDVAAIGEGERTWCELIDAAASRRFDAIAGIAYRAPDGQIRRTPAREPIANLDELPLPAYHLFPMQRYVPPLTKYRRLPTHMIIASRGCPYRCAFCAQALLGRRPRYRSPGHVIGEIRALVRDYGCRGIVFQDSSLCQNRAWVVSLCNELIAAGLGIEWSCLSRVEQVDPELLQLMRRAGCWQISFGVESANQKTLDFLRKGATVEQARLAVRAAHAAGIQVRATYMLALPGESVEDCLRTIRFARELGAMYATFLVTVPFPGTPLYDQALAAGQLRDFVWDDYSLFTSRLFFTDPAIPVDHVQRLCRRAHLRYYSSPRVLLRHLRQLPAHLPLVPRYAMAAAGVLRTSLSG